MKVPVLLLSGAGLPAWIWDDVRPHGAVVAAYPRGRASLADHADAVAAQAPVERFVVVAHSIGGVVAAELLARHPTRVAGVLGLCALVPPPGRSFVSAQPFPARVLLPAVLRVAGTRPPTSAVRRGVAAGLPTATADRLLADFVPESRRLYLDQVTDDRAPGRAASAARGYLRTTSDPEVGEALQTRSASCLAADWIEDVATGHLPQLEQPEAVVRALGRLLSQVEAVSGSADR